MFKHQFWVDTILFLNHYDPTFIRVCQTGRKSLRISLHQVPCRSGECCEGVHTSKRNKSTFRLWNRIQKSIIILETLKLLTVVHKMILVLVRTFLKSCFPVFVLMLLFRFITYECVTVWQLCHCSLSAATKWIIFVRLKLF